MSNSESSSHYAAAGVDTAAGQKFVSLIGKAVKSTFTDEVMPMPGGFAGILDVSFLKQFDNPVLVTGTDGVGTKLHLATLFNRHDTVGIDLVAMCTNDILVNGAKPLFFLDYVATGKLEPEQMQTTVESICEGCRQAGAALLGGETAEHPGLMKAGEYDLAGFVVGAAEKDKLINGADVTAGDVVVALPSSGVHSNGISLIRKVFLKNGVDLPDSQEDRDFLLNEILLRPTLIYEKALRPLLDEGAPIKGLSHITGGGFFENIPRVLPQGVKAIIEKDKLNPPELFKFIQERGNIPETDMYSVFNMGVGMILICPADAAEGLIAKLNVNIDKLPVEALGKASVIGRIEKQDGQTQIEMI